MLFRSVSQSRYTGRGKGNANNGAAAENENKASRVPIKVERAKAQKQADLESGVTAALQQLSLRKKQKQQKVSKLFSHELENTPKTDINTAKL